MSEQRWEEAAQKLILETNENHIRWQRAPAQFMESRPNGDDIRQPAFYAQVNDKWIAVYEYRYKSWGFGSTSWEWEYEITVEFVDAEFRSLFIWPAISTRALLLDAIRRQDAGADAFLDAFLASSSAG